MQTAAVKSTAASAPPRKRLLFDRRYGWVLDELKEPSEEALAGGRGMFCIVPLAKALIKKASETINFVGSSTLDVLQRPELLSPKAVQATLTDQMHNFVSSVKNAELVLMAPARNNTRESTSGSSDPA
ncbi:hypothetical protein C2S52_012748 [Perilla frutescens var. hirtella]|uniref:Uncharacterized protein n=1 Tax=Perilla frutescens var. hirtella TaxID=608512 RepID=A0AAD4JHJ8_PERFH|nr:hypothetical protein C2S51_015126 [Perilla frutescens var. frutescens]KAH6775187.1 hypothetical protein C2S52_012748 [Perilla frutescens var. hirtella]KAH6795350.1 hypothetical protein C2S51_036336 [Perilla frutescens var. frutescens]KAH6833983.1 hypothetical protein C2S53_004785 [Perilla frutescens var. hirtella]